MRGLPSTIALIAVLAGLGAYIYFVDSARPAGGVEARDKVFVVDSDEIEEIRLTAEGETSLLRKTDGTWRLAEPTAAEADQTEVSSLTSSLATLEVNRVVEEEAADLKQYGLANPRITIAFKAQNASGELRLGDKTPTQSDLYAARSGDNRVFLISSYLESTFEKSPFELRNKRILLFERDKADLVEIVQGTETIQLARDASDWTVRQPVQARGDYGAIEGLLTRLSTTNMTRIVEDATVDRPVVTVTVGAGSSRATLAVEEGSNDDVLARDTSRDLVFAVDRMLLDDLKKTADDYRNKDVFEFRSYNVARLQIARGATVYEFEKAAGSDEAPGDTWRRVGASAEEMDADKMQTLLSRLSMLRAQSFAPRAAPGEVDLEVAASYDGGKFERVRVGRSGDEVLAAREGEPGAARLDPTAHEDVLKALDDLVAPPTT